MEIPKFVPKKIRYPYPRGRLQTGDEFRWRSADYRRFCCVGCDPRQPQGISLYVQGEA
jgi:hypothetical protein